jgi:alpha-galactosidase
MANNSYGNTVWCKFLEGGDIAIGMFNMTDSNQIPYFIFSDIGLNRSCGVNLEITDLWTGEKLGVFRDQYRARLIGPHECIMLRCKVVYE